MPQGSFGVVRAWNDFTAPPGGITTGVPDALYNNLGGGWGLVGVNEGIIDLVVDEANGWLSITTDTGDNDNHAIVAGAWRPSAGGMEMEIRLKPITSYAATRLAIFVGFTETLALNTPVMPCEIATTTATYNGTGGMAGFVFDSDSTSLIWRFVAGDAGVALATVDSTGTAGAAIGIDCAATITLDKAMIFRLEMTPDGICRGLFGDASDTPRDQGLKFIGRNTAALTPTKKFHACALIENRVGSAHVMEVDYADARGFRDWSV